MDKVEQKVLDPFNEAEKKNIGETIDFGFGHEEIIFKSDKKQLDFIINGKRYTPTRMHVIAISEDDDCYHARQYAIDSTDKSIPRFSTNHILKTEYPSYDEFREDIKKSIKEKK